MKKLLSLVVLVVLVLSIASFASAGTITWTGDLREWYMYDSNPNAATNYTAMSSFQFDRVELQFVDAFSATEGLSALYQWRNYAGNDGSNSVSKTVQARLDSGFYYKKGLFSKYDEFDIGALDKLAFRLGLSKNCNFVDTGLGSKLKIGNSTGVRYEIDDPNYTIGGGIVDANMKDIYDTVNTVEGFAYSVRLDAGKNFFGMVPGLRLGFGYNVQPTAVAGNAYTTNSVIDVAYVQSLYWASLEHAAQVNSLNGKDGKYTTADYYEVGMNFGTTKAWAGRLISGDDPMTGIYYKDQLGGNVIPDKTYVDGTILAVNVPFANKVSLQGQYIVLDTTSTKTKTASEIDVRFRYDF